MRRTALVVGAFLLVACEGTIGTAPGTAPAGGDGGVAHTADPGFVPGPPGSDEAAAYEQNSFADSCDPESPPSGRPMLRLTKRELSHTLRDVLAELAGAAAGAEMMDGVMPLLRAVPEDGVSDVNDGLFPNAETVVQSRFLELMLPVARAIGQELDARAPLLSDSCDLAADAECFQAFLESDAAIILRRPLTPEDVSHYVGVYAEGGLPTAMAALFMAPHFLFHTEYTNSDDGGAFELDPYELAARLSYALWGTSPDAELREAAASGALATSEGFRAEAERLFFHERGEENLRHFVREWLELEDVPLLDLSDPRASLGWRARPSAPQGIDPAQLREEIIAEIEDLVVHHVYGAQPGTGGLSSLLQSRKSNAGDLLSEAIYEETPDRDADGWFELSDPHRAGILGRAGYQMVDGVNRRPIIKGVRLLERILCRDLPAPADNATPPEAVLEDDFTTRERTSAITEIEGTSCLGCHSTINPLGFAMESFDAFGRRSEVEHIIDPDDAEPTEFLAERPVDPTVTTHLGDSQVTLEGPADLTRLVSESYEAHQCFARFWWRYVNRRMEEISRDGCHLEAVYNGLDSPDDGLAMSMLDAVLHSHFRARHFRSEP